MTNSRLAMGIDEEKYDRVRGTQTVMGSERLEGMGNDEEKAHDI
jgi:hypothetical protein